MPPMTESGFVEFNHGRIYYEVDGEGPALTLVHAGVANLRQWDEQVPAFAERFRVIRYDCRTFGRTTSENVEISNRGDLAAVLDHVGVQQTAVIGVSRGGSIAVDFTLLWDEYDRRYEAGDWDWIVDTETAFWVDGPRQPPDRVPAAIRDRVHDWIAQGYRDHAQEDPTSQPLEPPAVNRLREIRVPTLVMVGDLDEGGTIEACRKLATDIPGARFELFEGVAHMVNLEQPERFTRLVLDFLTDAGVNAAPATAAARG
ncbi:MAG: alpha/beta fold hydrolase [Chloroflexi bacterium]|nr:MAG: alpha/beta fold hydrolase [Chloroflexota bacterium]